MLFSGVDRRLGSSILTICRIKSLTLIGNVWSRQQLLYLAAFAGRTRDFQRFLYGWQRQVSKLMITVVALEIVEWHGGDVRNTSLLYIFFGLFGRVEKIKNKERDDR